jgi:hypothetical protein
MAQKPRSRILAVVLLLAVCAFGVQAASHWHDLSHDEDHCTCQLCHVGHVAIPQPAGHVQIESALPVARFIPIEKLSLGAEALVIQSSPRAPPA